jgi:S-phase kinase-associated protein 1
MSLESLDFKQDTLDTNIVLECRHGERIVISKQSAKLSDMLRTVIENSREDDVIPLRNISVSVMNKICEYFKHYENCDFEKFQEIEKPIRSTNMRDIVNEWDAEFINVKDDMLFELISASNYLDIKPLLDLSCAKIATKIKDKSIEKIKKIFEH